jgi:hypothetical protein
MKNASFISVLSVLFLCRFCDSSTKSAESISTLDTTNQERNNSNTPTGQTHLKDTMTLSGRFILFLTPDSARFESLKDKPGIYDVDSDFGVGMANTIDTIRYKNIFVHITDKRFIQIKDCADCPILIDRDTVNYGVVLSSYGNKLDTRYNEVHSGDYKQLVDEYFQIDEK